MHRVRLGLTAQVPMHVQQLNQRVLQSCEQPNELQLQRCEQLKLDYVVLLHVSDQALLLLRVVVIDFEQ